MAIVQIGQHATDLQRASEFYSDLLGCPPTAVYDPPGLVFFVTDGVRLLLDRSLPSSVVYFSCDDVPARLNSLRSKGVEVVSEPTMIFRHEDDRLGPAGTNEWQAFVRDSEGNLLGLVEHRRDG